MTMNYRKIFTWFHLERRIRELFHTTITIKKQIKLKFIAFVLFTYIVIFTYIFRSTETQVKIAETVFYKT